VTEQTEPYTVVIRCDWCWRRHGHAPALAIAENRPGRGWSVWGAHRGGRRGLPVVIREGGAPHGQLRYIAEPPAGSGGHRSKRLVVYPITAAAAQLVCSGRGCNHKPREAVRRLADLAEQAAATGRADIYV
jgi:hypothetical protein